MTQRNPRTIVADRQLFAGLAILVAMLLGLGIGTSHDQPATPPASVDLAVPTTRVLAIGSWTAKASPKLSGPILPSEVRDTVRLYLAGKIDQWFVKQDHSGVVFLMNVTDPNEAHALLEKLPLGQAGLMEFQLIPLGPISPLRMLLSEPAK